ncbi:hypothetical protein HCN44_007112 [Aphidius gifuensis]|uniref:Uncharacterized protein n=1 Tax=Aphidius gifuensis TaxID=684658 RepID=A0A835CM10_APHGI|nr:hypothetical protein HCN44_007112 [Aphidius gifuensis]
MEGQGQNKTTPTEIKKEPNKDMTIQLESIKKQVLNESKKNCENSRDKQSTIVEQQQKQDQQHQQQPELIKIKSAMIIDHQINSNEPEKIAEQIQYCSTNLDNPGYPGFVEAIRQAKGKKKSYDVSFQVLFSCFPESVIKQHDTHLNKWWNYCLNAKKDPLETNLSVFIGYLEEKLDAGASCDDIKSISSTICIIASEKMARQIHSLTFLFLEFAKYSFVNTNSYPTPELSCQNESKISSKMQEQSKISSVEIESVKKSKLPEFIDISDDDSGTGVSEKNRIVPITGIIDDQQINVPTNNTKQLKKKNLPPGIPLKKIMNHVVVGNESGSSNKKNLPTPIPIRKQKQAMQPQQLTLQSANNNRPTTNVALPTCRSDQSLVSTPAVSSKLKTSLTKTSTPAAKPPTATLPIHHNTPQLINNKYECNSATSNTAYPLTPDGIQRTIGPVQQISTSHEQNYQLLMSEVDDGVNGKQYNTQNVSYTKADENNIIPEEYLATEENTHQIKSQEVLSLRKNIEEPITGIINDQEIQLIDMTANNTLSQIPYEKIIEYVVVDDESDSSCKKYPTTPIAVPIQKQKEAMQQQQSTLPTANELSNDNNVLSNEKCLQDDYDDNNIHKTSTVNINEPKYNDERLAVCDNCGMTSLDFNHCYYCKEKIRSNPKTVAYKSRHAMKKDMIVAIEKFYQRGKVNNDIMNDHKKLNLHTTLICRTVKIGSYKYTPKEPVIINTSGLILSVPLLKDETQTVKVHVKDHDIVKVLIQFDDPIPVLSFHTNTESGLKIRKLLGMHNPKKPYYDPTSKNQTQKRLMLLPESLNDKAKIILKKLFSSNNLIKELAREQDDDILLKSSPKDLNNSSLNINKRQSTIGNTNSSNIVENMTLHAAKESIVIDSVESSFVKLSSNSTQVITIMTIEKPKYVDGKLAVCNHCGFSSIDFNRCYYCENKIPNNPKTKLDTSQPEQKKQMMLSIDKFYKSLATNNIKINRFDNNISPHTICSTSKSKNLLSPDEDKTTDSDNNSQGSAENKLNNNKRKRSQLEEENSN